MQLTGAEREFIEPYLPIGEYGPYPERLRQQFEGVIRRFKTGGQWREVLTWPQLLAEVVPASHPKDPVVADPKWTWGWVTGTVYFDKNETGHVAADSAFLAVVFVAAPPPFNVYGVLNATNISRVAWNAQNDNQCVEIKIPLFTAYEYSGGYGNQPSRRANGMGSSAHVMVPPLLVAAAVLLAVRLVRQRRSGHPVQLLPRSMPARMIALAVIALAMISGALAGDPWAALVPAVTLGGLVGAFVDLRYGSPR